MDVDEVGEALGYVRRGDRRPDRDKVRRLVREGRLPGPIDDELPVVDWRWSRRMVERYAAGEVKARSVS